MEKIQSLIIVEEGQVNCRNSLVKSWVTGRWSYIYDHPITKETLKLQQLSSYHLYVISDEGIRGGDWFYNTKYKTIQRIGDITEFDFKIIATTNQKLNLPIIEPRFINEFLEFYKYKELDELGREGYKVKVPYNEDREILISKDNFINLKRIKQTFTREEVYKIAEDSFKFGLSSFGGNSNMLRDWFNENY